MSAWFCDWQEAGTLACSCAQLPVQSVPSFGQCAAAIGVQI
jgi:hypothetical protein